MHQRQALALRLKGTKIMIEASLKKYPEDINDVYDLLVNKGRLHPRSNNSQVADDAKQEKGEDQIKKAENDSKPNGEDGADRDTPGVAECLPVTDPELSAVLAVLGESVPETYVRLNGKHGLPGKAWRALLAALEPVVFSKFAVQALVPSGKREIDIEDAARLCEFMTGLDDQTSLTGDLRKTRSLVSTLRELNQKAQRPAKDMRIPPDWSTDGWWRVLDHSEDELELECLAVGQLTVKPEFLGLSSGSSFLQVTVDKMWSKARCEVKDPTGARRVNCMLKFMELAAAKAISKAPAREHPDGHTLPPVDAAGVDIAIAPEAKKQRVVAKSEVDVEAPPASAAVLV